MEFLVDFEVEVPAGTPDAEVEQQRPESVSVRVRGVAVGQRVAHQVMQTHGTPCCSSSLLVDFELGAFLLDHVALVQDLEELLGLEVDVVARNALKPREERICAEAIGL